jgi:hypothetical protein
MSDEPGHTEKRWSEHFEKIDLEIARHALACKIPLLDPGIIERVLKNDTLVCGRQNQRAFDSLRSLLMMHYSVRDNAVVAFGEQETLKMVTDVVARLRKRFGDKLGGPPG